MLKVTLDLDLKKNQLEDYNMKNLKHYNLLSELFRYPSENFLEKLLECQSLVDTNYPEAALQLQIFTDYMSNCNADEREEIYTKSFDVQSICYLDLGYVIFGEDYKRGAFLLHMQSEQKRINNDCGFDLSDNICNVFTLMAKSDDEDFVNELTVEIIIPAVKKMIAEFQSARVDLKLKVLKKLHKAIIQEELNQGNVYKNCFEAILIVLETDFDDVVVKSGNLNKIENQEHHDSFFNKSSVN